DRMKLLKAEMDALQAFGSPPAWIVDALFGTGLTGPIRGVLGHVIEALNQGTAEGVTTLAVDIPSGLDCDTGEPLGPTIRAAHTATFVALKQGFANPSAAAWLGKVHVLGIGAPRRLLDLLVGEAARQQVLPPTRCDD